MTSTITLYYGTLLKQSRNFLLDVNGAKGIETYLQTIQQKVVINNFQYIKQALNITIKVDLSQYALSMGSGSPDLNYVSIQNNNEPNVCYYFVTSKTWRSQNTIELVLAMDTLNTYQYNSDYTIDKKTFIKRQHKDRFSKSLYHSIVVEYDFTASGQVYGFVLSDLVIRNCKPIDISINVDGNATGDAYATAGYYGSWTINGTLTSTGAGHVKATIYYTASEMIVAKIDLKSEEINTPVYKINEKVLYEKDKEIMDWSLYYKNSSNQENAPVDCYLVPEDSITFNVQQNSGSLHTGNVPQDKYLMFFSPYNDPNISFLVDGVRYTPKFDAQPGGATPWYKWSAIAVFNDGGTIKVYWAEFYQYLISSSLQYTGTFNLIATSPTTLKVDNSPETIYANEVDSLPNARDVFINRVYEANKVNHDVSMGSYTTSTIGGLNTIDKTLSTNIKLIHIPYSPTPYEIENNIYTFDSCWTYNSADGKLKLTDFTKRFHNTIQTGESNILYPLFRRIGVPQYGHPDITQDINRSFLDPKLYHSDYYRNKFVYDSFAKEFPLERIDVGESSHEYEFNFDFVMSRNIVSKFLFIFNQYKYSYSMEDYENILPVSRNNEEVLYSSQYLDYLRSGDNYDLKAKERQQSASGIGIGLNVAGLLASIGLSFVPGGQAIGIGGVIAGGLGLASQLVGYAKNTAQNEENIQRKLQETQLQAIAVQNADDYDLLYAYSKNKAKLVTYWSSPRMRDVLDDLFYYCGYVVNEQGIPNVSSRRSFNFLQASLEVSATNNLTSEILDDIKEKFENGVTFLHYSFNKFDFAQDKENIELSLLS